MYLEISIWLCFPVFQHSYQILEFLYEKKHMYDKTIDCYLKDPLRKVNRLIYLLFLRNAAIDFQSVI